MVERIQGTVRNTGPWKDWDLVVRLYNAFASPHLPIISIALQYDNSALQGKELEDTDLTWVGIFREAKGKSSDKNKVTRKIWSLSPLQLPIETLKIAQLLARWTYNLTLKPYLPSFLLLDASFLTKKIKK